MAPKPAGLDWAEAAALPVAAETAPRVLGLLEVAQGDTVLIHGAAGAVGTVAAQIAVARGATVIGTASEPNHDYLRELGATPVVYDGGLVDRVRAVAPDGVDAVFDAAGQGALPDSIELRGGTSHIVTIADPEAFRLGVPFSGEAARDAGALAEVASEVLVPISSTNTKRPASTTPKPTTLQADLRNSSLSLAPRLRLFGRTQEPVEESPHGGHGEPHSADAPQEGIFFEQARDGGIRLWRSSTALAGCERLLLGRESQVALDGTEAGVEQASGFGFGHPALDSANDPAA